MPAQADLTAEAVASLNILHEPWRPTTCFIQPHLGCCWNLIDTLVLDALFHRQSCYLQALRGPIASMALDYGRKHQSTAQLQSLVLKEAYEGYKFLCHFHCSEVCARHAASALTSTRVVVLLLVALLLECALLCIHTLINQSYMALSSLPSRRISLQACASGFAQAQLHVLVLA